MHSFSVCSNHVGTSVFATTVPHNHLQSSPAFLPPATVTEQILVVAVWLTCLVVAMRVRPSCQSLPMPVPMSRMWEIHFRQSSLVKGRALKHANSQATVSLLPVTAAHQHSASAGHTLRLPGGAFRTTGVRPAGGCCQGRWLRVRSLAAWGMPLTQLKKRTIFH